MEIISYHQMTTNEGGTILQRGMNFGIKGSYSVVLMSVASNAPYADEMLEGGVIKYEGHDAERVAKEEKKKVDQPRKNPSGSLTQNGKFAEAASDYKKGEREPARVKVYRKLRAGVWVDMGFYDLIDSFLEHDGTRNVFKFLLKPIRDSFDPHSEDNVDLSHDRRIPGEVMQQVFARDQGKCVECGSTDNLHFDHKIPFSKGGSSKDAKNIQLLCARHNLTKRDKLIY
jgi:hypothetical protein